jgi:hypothetical protein
MSRVPLNIGFRQDLTDNEGDGWLHLCRRLMDVPLSMQPGVFVWKCTTSGLLRSNSLYRDYMDDHTKFLRT